MSNFLGGARLFSWSSLAKQLYMIDQINKMTIMPLFIFSSISSHGILFYHPHAVTRPIARSDGVRALAATCAPRRPHANSCSPCPQLQPCPCPRGCARARRRPSASLAAASSAHLPRRPHALLPVPSFAESKRGTCSLFRPTGVYLCQMELGWTIFSASFHPMPLWE
jgi:hypothetical protein